MNDGNQQKPAGYGHDKKATAGEAANEGRVHVAPDAPTAGGADSGGKSAAQSTTKTFTIDDRAIDIRAGETIFRAARRRGIKLPHCVICPSPVTAPTAIAASAWSRSKASGCWRQAVSARPRRA